MIGCGCKEVSKETEETQKEISKKKAKWELSKKTRIELPLQRELIPADGKARQNKLQNRVHFGKVPGMLQGVPP